MTVYHQKFDIQEIWNEYLESHSEKCRNILMERYLYLVKYSAERIWVKLPLRIELDDLIQAGIFGLMDAIDAFDPVRGVKFETYCIPRIRGSILDELHSMDWVPRLVRARAHQLQRARQTLESQLGRIPTEKELAEELELDDAEFRRLKQDANAISLVSLNDSNENDGNSDIREIDLVQNLKSNDPVLESQKRELKAIALRGLTRAEKLILSLYYYEEMTMKEIGATLDLSESRVSQMHSSIVARLKSQLDNPNNEARIKTQTISTSPITQSHSKTNLAPSNKRNF